MGDEATTGRDSGADELSSEQREVMLEGKYRLLDELGRGGMGTVFRAYDESLDRVVAVKFLRPELQADADFTIRFRREARAMASIRHENVLQIFSFGESQGRSFFVMEHIEGQTADRVIADAERRGEQLPIDDVLRYIEQSTEGLGAIHDAGVIHRDIKPANIIIERDTGRAVIMDFGIGRRTNPGDTDSGSKPMGTPAYMAPEIVTGRALSRESRHLADLYALGITAYELLTLAVPFDGDGWVEVFVKHVSHEPEPPSSIRKEIPPELDRAILDLLVKQPEDRVQSCSELKAVVRGLLHPSSVPQPLPVEPNRPKPELVSSTTPKPVERVRNERRSGMVRGMRVIVADSENQTRYAIVPHILDVFPGCSVQATRSSAKAVELALGAPPQLLIAALDDPDLNGLELAALLRGHAELREVRLVLTAKAVTTRERRMLEEMGVFAVLLRPAEEKDIRRTLERVSRSLNSGSSA